MKRSFTVPFVQVLGKRYFVNTAQNSLLETKLHKFHIENGGKMVPFAGWSLPSVYEDQSIVKSVLHTRKYLSLFDVSHMLQLEVSGTDAVNFLEKVSVSDLQLLKINQATLSVFTNDCGGIVDDCIITRVGATKFHIVANASCSVKDLNFLKEKLQYFKSNTNDYSNVDICIMEDKSLLSLQGRDVNLVMDNFITDSDIKKLYFMNSLVMNVCGIEGCRVTRCGYTGENGIEICVPSSRIIELFEKLLSIKTVKLAGLGARDVLRIEAGLCLYGNEIAENISPIEAGYGWCIGKRRKREGGFCGSELILNQLKYGCTMKRVGLISKGLILRNNCKIFNNDLNVGFVTSGCYSPNLGHNIAMGYITHGLNFSNDIVDVQVRNKIVKAKLTKLPFICTTLYKK